MNSFLKTLAARALNQPQPIRPRLPSLFEPPPGRAVRVPEGIARHPRPLRERHRIEQPEVAERPAISHRVLRPPDQKVETDRVTSIRKPGIRDDREPRQTIDSPREPKEVSESRAEPILPKRVEVSLVANDSAPSRPRGIEPTGSKPIRKGDPAPVLKTEPEFRLAKTTQIEETHIVESRTELRTREQEADPEQPSVNGEIGPSIVIRPAIVPNGAISPDIEPASIIQQTPPAIRITIGRVEVQAIMQPAETTVAERRAPPVKALSLDEYLKQRNGEHR